MVIPAFSNVDDEPFPEYIAEFNDIGGWLHAWYSTEYSWRGWFGGIRPRLYYPAGLKYKGRDNFVAVDGMGRLWSKNAPYSGDIHAYSCTINPSSGKFERLTVQTRDSFCRLDNSTWDHTIIRNTTPKLFRLANFALGGIPVERRHKVDLWTGADKRSVLIRWIPATLGIFVVLFLQGHSQPMGKNPRAYLPFLYNGYRYPRLARNKSENRREILQSGVGDPSWTSGDIGTYRVLRPRYLCYLIEEKRIDKSGKVVSSYTFETRPVGKNDHTPYVFISYTKVQFNSKDEEEKINNYQFLFSMAVRETFKYANSVQDSARKPKAFWLDTECQPHKKYIKEEDREEMVTDEEELKLLTDQDVYTMSDIIRAAEHLIVVARDTVPTDDLNSANPETRALQGWGQRVWTLPEVILSKDDYVTIVTKVDQGKRISKLHLAEIAWPDAGDSRQLVEHFTNLPLSRLELVNVAMKCLDNRQLRGRHQGDRSYALMGLLRVRPRIDTTDSSFQAFARLSLPQDNDRLMERLISLLPIKSDDPWNKMSDQYNSTLWDVFPDIQVCGIGENDTVIVDGFKGAMIQWSKFSTVQTTKRISLKRLILIWTTFLTPAFFILGLTLLQASRTAAIVLVVLSSVIMCTAPVYVPYLYTGKLYDVEPCLFGIEGYVPVREIEEVMFGAKMGRLKWSPYGSPLSRHRYKDKFPELLPEDVEAKAQQPLLQNHDPVYGYPVESMDPCSDCEKCAQLPPDDPCTHLRYSSAEKKSRSGYGEMKLFTLIDTFSMTATLFEARHPPVALIIGGSEGGMKRALACSYDITTGTLYRETVLRVPSQIMDKMHSLQRVRLGLKNPFGPRNTVKAQN